MATDIESTRRLFVVGTDRRKNHQPIAGTVRIMATINNGPNSVWPGFTRCHATTPATQSIMNVITTPSRAKNFLRDSGFSAGDARLMDAVLIGRNSGTFKVITLRIR